MRYIKIIVSIFISVVIASSCSLIKKPVTDIDANCGKLFAFKTGENNVTIKNATVVPAGPVPPVPYQRPYTGTLEAYCRVDGVMDERIGEAGKFYAIAFSVAMPKNWNGRFMMQGGGGLNGVVATPLGTTAAGEMTALQRGFAVVTTDTGHQGAHGFDANFFSDQEATLNFLYQAIGKVAITSKQIVARYYGKSVAHSYYMGCSTGGREAMIMSQRYPRLFDGIVAGAPAMRTSFSNLANKWMMTSLAKVAPKDAQGHPIIAEALTVRDKTIVMDSLLKQCDSMDGVADQMISNVVGCKFDPISIACSATKKEMCISPEKAKAIKLGFAGPKNSFGMQVYPGFWFDTGITEAQGIPGLLNPGNHPIVGKIINTDMNVDQEMLIASTPAAFIGDTAHWTLLNTFSSNGGKLIFYHGVSDPWFSAQDTTRYYEQLGKDNGGKEKVSQWSRLFLVPGMGHCGGGSATLDQIDIIDPIVDWVEKHKAPEQLTVTGEAFPNRSRPLCPYPTYAFYTGTGDSENAENFVCKLQ